MMGVGHLNAARALMSSFSPDEANECSDIESLQALIEQQNLVIQTLLVVLLEKGVFKEEEFNECAKKMDLLDGVRDGRLSEDKSLIACPECGHQNPHTATKCEDCGKALEPHLIQHP